jgi:thioredoxin 1
MSDTRVFQEATFEEEVLQSRAPVLVDFSATWCGPCKMMAPVVEQLAGEYGDRLTVGQVDVDDNPGLAMRYNVRGVPTLGVFQGGEMVDRLVGYPGPAGVRAFAEKHAAPARA